ncbi:aldo/keto reductase [Pseudomonas sp. LB3P14]
MSSELRMGYSRLGDSGLVVSRYCWGAANLGTPLPWAAVSPHFDESTAREAAAIAIDHGVNFFDTADIYSEGEAEQILGRVLKPHRQDIVLSTKVGMRTGQALTRSGLSRRHILSSIDGSLKRLGTDWVDVYIAHRVDPHTPLEETLEALDQTVRSGKVRYLGYSNWPDWMVAKAVEIQRQNGWARFVTGQTYYSLVGRDVEYGTIPLYQDAGIGMMVWSPLAGGFLSGKYTRENPGGNEGRLSKMSFTPIDLDKGYAIVEVLRDIAERHRVSPANIAMAWLAGRPGVSTVLLGISRLDMMAENLKAATVVLSAQELQTLDEVSKIPAPYPDWFNAALADVPMRDALIAY